MQGDGTQCLTGVIQQFVAYPKSFFFIQCYLRRIKNDLGKRILKNVKYFSQTGNETTYTRLKSDQNSIFVLQCSVLTETHRKGHCSDLKEQRHNKTYRIQHSDSYCVPYCLNLNSYTSEVYLFTIAGFQKDIKAVRAYSAVTTLPNTNSNTNTSKCDVEQKEQEYMDNILVTNMQCPWSIKAQINT